MNDLLEVIKTLATPIAAGFGVFIAHKFGKIQAEIGKEQARTAALSVQTARNKLKLDLFDRRLVIYNTVATMLGQLSTTGNLSVDDERDYLVGINGAHWLFDRNVVEFLEITMWHQMVDFGSLQSAVRDAGGETNRKAAAAQKSKARQSLLDQRSTLDQIFEPYLKLEG